MSYTRIIIIGNGIAGLSAAEAARKKDQKAEIIIISNEKYSTYYRTRIAELFNANTDASISALVMRNEKWYAERSINLLLQKTVKSIDPDKRVITIQNNNCMDEEELAYDKLIITAGARCFTPDIPGINSSNVHVLRTLEDARIIANKLVSVKNVVVVGGGLLGLECAYVLNKKGIKTSIVEFKDRLLPNQLDEEGSEIFEDKVLSLGIDIIKGVVIDKIEDESSKENSEINADDNSNYKKNITLNNGKQIETDLVLFTAGACPNKETVRGTNIKTSRAIIVNKYMQTGISGIFSAGDVAEFDGKWYGLWSVALSQGKVAGHNAASSVQSNLLEEWVEYNPQIPPYFLNSMDTRVSSIGDIGKDPKREYRIEKTIDKQNHLYQKLYFVEDKIVGSILIGDTKKATFLGKAIEDGMGMAEVFANL